MIYCIKRIAKAFLLPILSYLGSKNARRYIQYARYRKRPVCSSFVLYESFYGRGMNDNPYALFSEFIKRPDFTDYTHIWILDDVLQYKETINTYKKKYTNVLFVSYMSKKYVEYLAKTKYLINNSTFPDFFVKRDEQVYLNTWHGIPLKCMGNTMREFSSDTNIIRNFLFSDFLLAANDHMVSMYAQSYKLQDLYDGTILLEGYPRVDFLFSYNKKKVWNELHRRGIQLATNKKLIVYAPTWRGNNLSRPEYEISSFCDFKEKLENQLHDLSYQILFKPHNSLYKSIASDPSLASFLVPVDFNTNELLAVTDILITDYSSIWFDYLATNNPVIFYMPDKDDYESSRGLFFNINELPGPEAKTVSDIAEYIRDIKQVTRRFSSSYTDWKKWTFYHDDGAASSRILKIFLSGKYDFSSKVPLRSSKKHICFDSGVLKRNGITYSLINLLHIIDYEKYDITLCIPKKESDLSKELVKILPTQVRLLPRFGKRKVGTIFELIRFFLIDAFGIRNLFLRKIFPQDYLDFELKRNTAGGNYDVYIQYSGFDREHIIKNAAAKKGKKIIWQHNDMVSERNRPVNGKKKFYRTLQTIFTFYEFFDRIVGCSREVMELNRKNIRGNIDPYKYMYCRNAINYEKILSGIEEDLLVTENGKQYLSYQSISYDGEKNTKKLVPVPDESITAFVNIGRLSAAKNQENLIKGFYKFSRKYPNTVLYIIGDGPLYRTLEKLIQDLDLEGKVILTGAVSNPFRLASECDCFILPSLFEGQPVVLLEARVLNLPIIVSNFKTVKSALVENGQYIIDTGIDDIAQGMKAFMENRVPRIPFDCIAYNQMVSNEFDSVINSLFEDKRYK